MTTRQWRKSRTFGEACWHAWDGVYFAARQEKNFRVQLVVYAMAMVLGVVLGLPARDLALVVLVSSFILTLEMVNTAIEALANVVDPKYHEGLRLVKDVAAGAVLVTSAAAIVIGLFLFIPALLY
ncbi:MAG: diacylglycerol kinase family protein [Candidatus Andersenbacteria bacterium]|nr:diacylglycerol kinase family protein [Candidatus Andersenbacteria bacterium]